MDGGKEVKEVEVLEGEQIYLLMKKEYRLSRNTRALWYFSHINKEIQVGGSPYAFFESHTAASEGEQQTKFGSVQWRSGCGQCCA